MERAPPPMGPGGRQHGRVVGWVCCADGSARLMRRPCPPHDATRAQVNPAAALMMTYFAAAAPAEAATQLADVADGRVSTLAAVFVPVLAWVAFNILGPAVNQVDEMSGKASGKTAKKR